MTRKSEWNKRCCFTVAVDGFRNNNNICWPPSPTVVNQFIGNCGRRQKRPRGRLESICIHLRTKRRQYYIRRANAFITAGCCCCWWCSGGEGGGGLRNNGYAGGWIRRIIIRNDTRGRNKWQQQQCNRCGIYTHIHTHKHTRFIRTHAYNIFMYVWTRRFIPYSVYDMRAIIY